MGHKTRGSHPTLQIRQVETKKLLSSYSQVITRAPYRVSGYVKG